MIAACPEDLNRLFTDRFNTVDVRGMVELYETGATIVFPPGVTVNGTDSIHQTLERVIEGSPLIRSQLRPTILAGDLALTSVEWSMSISDAGGRTEIISSVSVEVARRQPC